MQELKKLLKRLRDPNDGCPWDRVQTFESIAPNTVEEAYEVLEAVEKANYESLKEEIGDLLLHVLFYSDMAEEKGYFTFDDVVDGLCKKLIFRHPHVFGEADKATDASSALASWESVKEKERKEQKNMKGVLEGIAVTLPPSVRALKLQKRAARVGFDWDTVSDCLAKVSEELYEVKEVINNKDNKDKIEEEIGDLLFAVINLARKTDVDADTSLRKCNRKFEQRFNYIEQSLAKEGISLSEAGLDKMEELWQEAKKQS